MAAGRHEALLDELTQLAAGVAGELGVELVELSLRGSSRRRVLRVDIDRAGPRGIDIEDCKRLSNMLGDRIEESETLKDSYLLEVSSPGVDRPIQTADDIRRNTGRNIIVTTREPLNGQRSFRGRLEGELDGTIRLTSSEDSPDRNTAGNDRKRTTRRGNLSGVTPSRGAPGGAMLRGIVPGDLRSEDSGP